MPKFLAVAIFTAVAALAAGPVEAQMMSPTPTPTPTPTPAPMWTPTPTPTATPTATPEIIPPPVANPSQYQLAISVDPTKIEEEDQFTLTYSGAAPFSYITLRLFHDNEKFVHTFPGINVDGTGKGSVKLIMPHVRDVAGVGEYDGFTLEGDNSPYSKARTTIGVKAGGTPRDDKPVTCTSGKQVTISTDTTYQGATITVKITCAKPGSKISIDWIHPDDKWIPIYGIPYNTLATYGPYTADANGKVEAKLGVFKFLEWIETRAKSDAFLLKVRSEWPDNNFIYDQFLVTVWRTEEDIPAPE